MIRRFFLKNLNKYASRWLVLAIDLFLVCLAFVLAYFIRFNASFNFEISNFETQIPFIAVLGLISFLIVGSYKGIVRHTGMRDVFNVLIAVTFLSSFTFFIIFFNRILGVFPTFTIPVSIISIHYLVSVFLLTVSRFVFKAFYEIITTELGKVSNVLIYGAGDSGLITYAALNRDTQNNYEVLGFIDDDAYKINKKIDRIKIYNLEKITSHFIEEKQIKEIVLSIQNINASRLLELTDYFTSFTVEVKIVPPLSKWIGGDLQAHQIRDVNIDDLLGRAPILIENSIVQRDVNNKIILVTGAAGSIGSEISRQLSLYKYKQLICMHYNRNCFNKEFRILQQLWQM